MRITDAISITELAKLLGKSRPTVYKYISDFEEGNELAVPDATLELFHQITDCEISKKEILAYCEKRFGGADIHLSEQCLRIIGLLRKYDRALNLDKIEKAITKEINNL